MAPMFGEAGWCPSCGIPRHAQTGSIVLQQRGLRVEGAWVPNWQFDVICVAEEVADDAKELFNLEWLDVAWVKHGDLAKQIRFETYGDEWFSPGELKASAESLHGRAGSRCQVCGKWKWMPLEFGTLPRLAIDLTNASYEALASPEWFGDGMMAYRQLLLSERFADFLVSASPKDFGIKLV